ncbi:MULTISPECIES: gamma-glutamylcyclotransferase [unclassified Lentimonas]|uniref:gamma-glutamylcyclotransferase family protein n=1 Tax=unclassified Lentimonas TaxID=2630993 RepID=UPI001320E5DD|nr:MULTISPECIES: gamma-glutamylcyclotransferase family protein [unclassified Lentimonas]CAA6676398.1 Unannotated [Lentimonas sp. CC4]CAA6685237.1 Unannotated [Lentimonas sp. CC6]CAA6693426.1 Unannotated [Lentimonas sp. CC19]CAA6696463.1 Unannotated [Lentimonas sp. CC10]CAA7072367.1 Unannotated [Lentimonas sp. CC11]
MLSDQSVFVYGTLKPGGHYWPQFCEGKVSAVMPAKIRGELYDLHVGYPGVFMRGDTWVQGTVLTFPRTRDFEQLDVLEGFEPRRSVEENEYIRLRVDCFDPAGEPLGKVWAYEMTEATFQRFAGTRIVDGNWPIG